MRTPCISIITPCYQAGDKLLETIRSVLTQTFEDYEIIVKDAGSTDGSVERLPADPRIRLICSKDGGIYEGMNQAIAAAGGEYLYFLNCGDRLHDRYVLQRVGEAIEKRESGTDETPCIYYGDVMEMQTGQRVNAKPAMTHFAMYRNLPCHQACVYSRELFKERQFNTEFRVRADYEHFLWSVIRGGAHTVAMDLVMADYEGGGFSETKENRRQSAKEHRKITEMYFGKGELLRFRLAMLLSLQPLRARLASSRRTAALYDAVKNTVYRKRS